VRPPPLPGEQVDDGMSLVVVQLLVSVQPVVVVQLPQAVSVVHDTDVSQLVVQLVSVVQCAQLGLVQLVCVQPVCVEQAVVWQLAAAHDAPDSTCVSQPPSATRLADASSEMRMTESSFFMGSLRCSQQARDLVVPESARPR
jgi:hypothetical protein